MLWLQEAQFLVKIFENVFSQCMKTNKTQNLNFPPVKRFQATLADHISVEVCMVLPKFKLTMMQVKPAEVYNHTGGPDQPRAQTAGGAGRCAEGRCRDLAYVLHTSGTTGLPKIVKVPQRCILPNILHLRCVDIIIVSCPST